MHIVSSKPWKGQPAEFKTFKLISPQPHAVDREISRLYIIDFHVVPSVVFVCETFQFTHRQINMGRMVVPMLELLSDVSLGTVKYPKLFVTDELHIVVRRRYLCFQFCNISVLF